MAILGTPNYALQPNTKPTVTPGSYLTSADFTWLQQYLPDTYEAEFERYGNRSVSSFLRMVGAELPSNSDMITWAEQGRLHIKYTICTLQATGVSNTSGTYRISGADAVNMSFRPGATVVLQVNGTGSNAGAALRGIVTAVTQTPNPEFTVSYYDLPSTVTTLGLNTNVNAPTVTAFIYGSEFRKGIGATTNGTAMGSLDASDAGQFYQNNPIILKDKFIVSGSDMAQIGWVQVDTEEGVTGYLWYLKSASETRLRFDDYLETAMLEAIPAETGSGAAALSLKGTNGVFYEVNRRGNVWGDALPTTLVNWDSIVGRLDKQGAIEENALFVNRDLSFAIDNMLAQLNGYASGAAAQAASFGLFDNDVNMALNLGFSGFRRGYDFYKTDWKYLNDPTMRGALSSVTVSASGTITGLLVPAGTTNVYDQVMGRNAKRPFLHVRYRASETEDRRYKTWVTGSAGTAATNDIDNMEVNFLSERCVCVLGANNFMLFRYGA
jgi:hypothetical protein